MSLSFLDAILSGNHRRRRISEGGVEDGRAQIAERDAAADAAEELQGQGGPTEGEPGRHRLVEDQLGLLMPAGPEDSTRASSSGCQAKNAPSGGAAEVFRMERDP